MCPVYIASQQVGCVVFILCVISISNPILQYNIVILTRESQKRDNLSVYLRSGNLEKIIWRYENPDPSGEFGGIVLEKWDWRTYFGEVRYCCTEYTD